MDLLNKYSRFMRNSGPARVLVPIGVVLIVCGLLMSSFASADMVETVGTVTSLEEGKDDNNQTVYDVGFSYEAGGRQYSGVLYGLNGDYTVGGKIKVFYNADDPAQISNSKMSGLLSLGFIAGGAAALALGILRTVKNFRRSSQLDTTASGNRAPAADFSGYKNAAGVKELYCRHDGNALKPGYIVEDAGRSVLFEGKMVKNNLIGARTFEFTDHTDGTVKEHEVGHTVTETFNNEFFSASSWLKFDGENIWDVLHGRGLRMNTDLFGKFPNLVYEITRDGAPFARIETSSMYVHEEDEAAHKLAIPVGRYYYRIWTDSEDMETVFLTVFAISETEQAMVE